MGFRRVLRHYVTKVVVPILEKSVFEVFRPMFEFIITKL